MECESYSSVCGGGGGGDVFEKRVRKRFLWKRKGEKKNGMNQKNIQ